MVAQQPPNLLGVGSSPTGRVSLNKRGHMTSDEIKEMADPEAVVWTDFDEAIIGTDYSGKLVYNINKMIEILVTRDGMTEEEAMEYLDFNVFSAYVGELTPVHVYLHQ
jgi:hypothetical protein